MTVLSIPPIAIGALTTIEWKLSRAAWLAAQQSLFGTLLGWIGVACAIFGPISIVALVCIALARSRAKRDVVGKSSRGSAAYAWTIGVLSAVAYFWFLRIFVEAVLAFRTH